MCFQVAMRRTPEGAEAYNALPEPLRTLCDPEGVKVTSLPPARGEVMSLPPAGGGAPKL